MAELITKNYKLNLKNVEHLPHSLGHGKNKVKLQQRTNETIDVTARVDQIFLASFSPETLMQKRIHQGCNSRPLEAMVLVYHVERYKTKLHES